MKVLIVKNISREGPGLLQKVLIDNEISYDVIDLDKKEKIPETDDYSAVFVFGGPDSANDNTEKMNEELASIQKVIESKTAYLGICLGMQALVKACGGKIRKNNIHEIGWKGEDENYFTINILDEKISDPIFTGLENPLVIFHLHGETVDLTDNMELMATGKYCKNQIIKVGNSAYGFQGHFELTPEMFEEWIDNDPELKLLNRESIMEDFNHIYYEYQKIGTQIFTNFLKIAGLI